jgi:hypothetical protein
MANAQCFCTFNAFVSRQILTKVLRINSVLLRKAQNSQPQQTPVNTGFLRIYANNSTCRITGRMPVLRRAVLPACSGQTGWLVRRALYKQAS